MLSSSHPWTLDSKEFPARVEDSESCWFCGANVFSLAIGYPRNGLSFDNTLRDSPSVMKNTLSAREKLEKMAGQE